MDFNLLSKIRKFSVGKNKDIEISDLGSIYLENNELISFVTEQQNNYEIVRKNWGFYATPSMNCRLKSENFKTALVQNNKFQTYIMLVEKNRMILFEEYCKEENQTVLEWLDERNLDKFEKLSPVLECECKHTNKYKIFEYKAPPQGETDFKIPPDKYKRSYLVCKLCGHFFASLDLDMSNIYDGAYVESTYGKNIHEKFQKIISIKKNDSDNFFRIERIKKFFEDNLISSKEISLIDIGSGLGVFPYAAKKEGWNCTALDPDPSAAKHLKDVLQIDTIESNFFDLNTNIKYRFLTLNKVLEHVLDPVKMLKKTRDLLTEDGYIYIEVPDGEMAAKDSKEREEFFIEHYHVFSMTSLLMMIKTCNFIPLKVERIREPSGKYTLFAFIKL